MAHHRLDASPDTVHWGAFSAAIEPALTVSSGDTVTISTVSGGPDVLPRGAVQIPAALPAIHQVLRPTFPGHICTGPVRVREARAGQVLEIRIEAIDLHYDWGYTRSGPQKGALPDDFETDELLHIALDRSRKTGRLPWGTRSSFAPSSASWASPRRPAGAR